MTHAGKKWAKSMSTPTDASPDADAAKYIGVKSNTLNAWGSRGTHDESLPKIVVVNRVYYDFGKVKAFCTWQ